MSDSELQKRLEKLGAQLVSDLERWEERTRGDRQRVLEDFTHTLGDHLSKAFGKLDAAQQKSVRRQAERRAKEEARLRRQARRQGSGVGGAFMVLAGLLAAAFAVLRPDLWWMVFVAIGLFVGGGQQLGAALRGRRERRETEDEAHTEARHEVDLLCDQLLADLAASPEAVRTFISDPEKTVATLRATLKGLDGRRRQLLAEDAPAKLDQAQRRREELAARRDAANDPEARQRLGDALEGLDGQVAALRQLAAMTERVDGEYTALLVRLEELKTRVSVARSSGSAVQLAGLQKSVQRLNEELGAIGEAMAAVARGDVTPVEDVGGAASDSGAPQRERTR